MSNKILQIRIPEHELRGIKRIAKIEDTDVSKLIRKMIRDRIAKAPQAQLLETD